MFSTPPHRCSPYPAMLPNPSNSHSETASNRGHEIRFHPIAPSPFPKMRGVIHPLGLSNPSLACKKRPDQREDQPFGLYETAKATVSKRKRISRACDQCNQLRTKCDGNSPCLHCVASNLGCEYVRERRKRGKVSRKERALEAAKPPAAMAEEIHRSHAPTMHAANLDKQSLVRVARPASPKRRMSVSGVQSGVAALAINDLDESLQQHTPETSRSSTLSVQGSQPYLDGPMTCNDPLESLSMKADLTDHGIVLPYLNQMVMGAPMMDVQCYGDELQQLSSYAALPYPLQTQNPPDYLLTPTFALGPTNFHSWLEEESMSPIDWRDPITPVQPASIPCPVPRQNSFDASHLRYPVLEPLLPYVGNIIPVHLACDLFDLYCAFSASTPMDPMSPYVLGLLFRTPSLLHPTRPRKCQPALLSSMLWVAAQTADSPSWTSVPAVRSDVCRALLELTVNLLKPVVHAPLCDELLMASPVAQVAALGGPIPVQPGFRGQSDVVCAEAKLDDVVAYIHLASVMSARECECKSSGLRWWNEAWSLARELKLGREYVPPYSPQRGNVCMTDTEGEASDSVLGRLGITLQEMREERRRTWWLVYLVDRHLALCYNRPLFLLDVECDGLLQPMDNRAWQQGDFPLGSQDEAERNEVVKVHVHDSQFECTSHTVFGCILPLMTILGEIVDLRHARNHPRFGIGCRRSSQEWDQQAAEIRRQLKIYEHSLSRFGQSHLNGVDDGAYMGGRRGRPVCTTTTTTTTTTAVVYSSSAAESDRQTRLALAYGTYLMRVLHILLPGKWDLTNILQDRDGWLATESCFTTTRHAISAADALRRVLEADHGLELMPCFLGVYLLQNSFLLLLHADRLPFRPLPAKLISACDIVIRAHESGDVGLNAKYQIDDSFPGTFWVEQRRRQELLTLYRWTGHGAGLAL